MKFVLPLLSIVILFTACKQYNNTLYLDKYPSTAYGRSGIGTNYSGVLTVKEQTKVFRYLEKNTAKPIVVVGKDKSINSYREFCEVMEIQFPSMVANYNVFPKQLEGMDYKDIWLSKGPPISIFVTDEFVTWRYKDDSLVVFVDGKTVTVNNQH